MQRMKISIIDLVSGQPASSLYARAMNANFASIMPQVTAVWCEELGHQVRFTCCIGSDDIRAELTEKTDILIISAFTHSAQLAYAISNLYRQHGAVTVLGGPHARCYPEDASLYFDYVLGLTDKKVIEDLLADAGPHRPVGRQLTATKQPKYLAGAMGPDGCDKCCGFIALCDSFNIPLIFLHDTPGFLVGKLAEEKRVPGKIINFIEALCLSTVPKLTVIVRKSYGMATGNMAGPGMGADFVYAWPTADISFMAPETAANVVYARKIMESDDPEKAREAAVEQLRLGSAPYRAAGLGYLDDVIEPQDTRRVLIDSLHIARGQRPNGGMSERRLANWPTTF